MMRWVAVVLAALGCAACNPRTPRDRPREDPTVDVGYSALRISLPVFVAEERGLFAAHGLDVRLKRFETAQPLVEEVLDGRLLAGGYAALPIVFTAASKDGSRARLATAMVEDRDHPVSYLLRGADRHGLASAADLAHRRVGILPTVAYRRWAEAVLRHAGVDPTTVRLVPVAPAEQTMALAGGAVDAMLTNDPMATAALAAGAARALPPAAPVPDALGGPLLFGSFLLHPRLIRERPAVARALVAALDDAIAIVNADPAAAREAMRPYVRPPERAYVDRYPPARYLESKTLDAARLSAEVANEERFGLIPGKLDARAWLFDPGAGGAP